LTEKIRSKFVTETLTDFSIFRPEAGAAEKLKNFDRKPVKINFLVFFDRPVKIGQNNMNQILTDRSKSVKNPVLQYF